MTATAEVPFIFLSPFYTPPSLPPSLTRGYSCYYNMDLPCFYTYTAYVSIHKHYKVLFHMLCVSCQ